MNTYIENYGFTKTVINDNKHKTDHQIEWVGDYDGNIANIQLNIDDDGSKKFVSMQLDNDDLMKILGVQPVAMSLENRLSQDFLGKPYSPIALEGALIKRKKTRKRRRHHKKHQTRHHSASKRKRTY